MLVLFGDMTHHGLEDGLLRLILLFNITLRCFTVHTLILLMFCRYQGVRILSVVYMLTLQLRTSSQDSLQRALKWTHSYISILFRPNNVNKILEPEEVKVYSLSNSSLNQAKVINNITSSPLKSTKTKVR